MATETRYTPAVGRRKTATATVRLTPAAKTTITVNGKPLNEYFKTAERVTLAKASLHLDGIEGEYEITAKVMGGGVSAQAEAVRHAIARALEKLKPELRKILKPARHLTRDPRAVERKKPGLLKARKRPSWSKR